MKEKNSHIHTTLHYTTLHTNTHTTHHTDTERFDSQRMNLQQNTPLCVPVLPPETETSNFQQSGTPVERLSCYTTHTHKQANRLCTQNRLAWELTWIIITCSCSSTWTLPVCDELRETEPFFDGQTFNGTDQWFAQVQLVNLPSKQSQRHQHWKVWLSENESPTKHSTVCASATTRNRDIQLSVEWNPCWKTIPLFRPLLLKTFPSVIPRTVISYL